MSIANLGCTVLKVDKDGKFVFGPEKANIKVFEGEILKEKPEILAGEDEMLKW